jgi:hypothetical protein
MFSKPPPSSDKPPQPRRACWGLVTRRERWGFSFRGWLVLLVATVGLGIFLLLTVHSFLAVTSPTNAEYLVVEGWIHDYAFDEAVVRFRAEHYKKLFTTGGPVRGLSGTTDESDTYASVARNRLIQRGLSREEVIMVPTFRVERDRTYASAVALRDWLAQRHLSPVTLNVATLGVHARRTRLLYEKAFGNEVKIGIIAIPNQEYDNRRWWKYSEGVKEVFGESLGYFYARFIF